MRYCLIACEVFTRELCAEIARCPNEIDVQFLPKGLHDLGSERMASRLEETFATVDQSLYDAVLFGYGLCNNGLAGLRAGSIPLVLPRAHDCITVFLGSRERYRKHFEANPGTYYLTSGWIERGEAKGELAQLSLQSQSGMNMSWDDLVEKYGEDNAEFLWEELVQHEKHYGKYVYIEMGVEPDDRFEKEARRRAEEKGWTFEKERGDRSILKRLLAGDWGEEDFLVVPPGSKVKPSYDERIIEAVAD